mmetsp:Transcript_7126/g.9921  ORF Transcript_7126/g.9921 Transcript_7126/m.9921 type:complete len:210 (+) Transcript_7126:50-679(+)|eukprot:CAMPEP_0185567428 /NCGR_PEP_ID=MMETSP0434-20130131/713_1 /TAXON_ID=626734 ORGANISM="Favella taraikaensis, Strain Fe Narragansett Bay" /NCGR_SAMPLE_ID=MMETSP0434 /ASSEMBLY_ACC=CAM_ASM_000379 /LENGTH=209 /DNA_ID=CAMNT_0028181665 /DNA_START=24 /DNA_END=653 /DNA_ORIENTATION=-
MNRIAPIAATLALSAEAAIRWTGCPTDYKPMEGALDMDRYAGKWYEIIRDKWYAFEWLQMCGNYEYSKKDDGKYQVVYNRWTPLSDWTDSPGCVMPAEGRTDAAISVDFDKAPDDAHIPVYTVMDTDYDSYSVIYQCEEYWWGSYDGVWILSRERTLDDATMGQLVSQITQKLPEYGFFENHMMTPQGESCVRDEEEEPEKFLDVDQNN